MDLKELDSFKMSDAIAFHDQLNPKLFHGQNLRPDVDEQLKVIAQDFLSELGIKDLDVKDITISGSNAAYSYTPHSDLDLHILVDLSQYSDDAVYQELFHAKKNLYNESHDITINGIPVELYIQDASEPVVSLGEYSILKNKWLRIPSKRRSNFDQTATKQKYEKLSKLAEYALHAKNLGKVKKVLDTIKRYRQAGLDVGGEFGPENLAYKMLRSQGIITKLYDLRDKLHSQRLSIEGMYSIEEDSEKMYKNTPTIEQLVIKYKVPKRDILIQLDKGIKVELKGNKDRDVARKIALNHLRDDPHYYNNIDEDYDPNGPPPGPEMKPTMPAGTLRVDVSDVYDWYKLGQNISNLDRVDPKIFGKGPPSTIMAFGSEPEEHKYIANLKKLGLTTTDIDPLDPKQPKSMPRQKVDPTYNVNEGFDNPYPVTWEKSEFGSYDALAKLDDGTYLSIMFNNEGDDEYQIEFHRNNSQEVTGEGDAQRIFATVLNAIQEFLKKEQPYHLIFSASKDVQLGQNGKSRAKLYDRLVKRYANVWGYDTYHEDHGDQITYELTKLKQSVAEDTKSTEHYNGIEISLEKEDDEITVTAMMPSGRELGHVLFVQEGDYLMPQDLEVDERYRGQGIASTMYNYVKSQGYKIRRSGQQTDAGAGFWGKHRPEQNVWEASGYIPSEKQKNDPRFSTALTLDVKPDSIKKNAKAFAWLTNRAGVPPTAKANGKIS